MVYPNQFFIAALLASLVLIALTALALNAGPRTRQLATKICLSLFSLILTLLALEIAFTLFNIRTDDFLYTLASRC